MKTIGLVLREARIKKKISKRELEELTRIKSGFVDRIEREQWSLLPEFPVVLGFTKSMAGFLGLEVSQVTALLRRDYPPQKAVQSPKPDVGRQFVWTPKLTFLLGSVLIILAILSYLGFQYIKFTSPPFLSVVEPRDEQVIKTRSLEVWGKTDPGATIRVNNQPVLVSQTGEFKTEIDVSDQTQIIEIKAVSRAQKETTVTRQIKVEWGK